MSTLSFKDLLVWKEGHQLVLLVYKYSETFPSKEQFGLTNQIRRAAVSITSNIAEGFVRKNKKEKIQFYYMALGSLSEVQNQLLIAFDINYINENYYQKVQQVSESVGRLLNSLISSTKQRDF